MNERQPPDSSGEIYQIRLEGRLDRRWFEWFDGFEVDNLATGVTQLTGKVIDQAALHGVLERIRDLNLKLIAINRIEIK